MGAIFSRIKTWVSTEDVTYSDLNAEFDNILTNLVPAMIDDYSANVSQMQTTTDPGEVGTESLATTIAGELARLRHMIKEITGEDKWYESATASIAGLANAIGTGLSDNRLVSGRVRSTSDQPTFLVPNGAARTVKLDGTPTNFIYYIEGIEYIIDADVTVTNLTAAPSSNNTCLVNDAIAAGQYWTKYAGEDGSEITIDTVGSEITALVGKYAAFKLAGAATEYFIAKVETNKLIQAKRGYFFDSTDAPVSRTTFSNNDTITLMKLTWIFAKSDDTITATYSNPIWSLDEPTSPSIGDYWFDYAANKWKKYDVSSYIDADAILVGVCIQDTTNTVGARSFEFFDNYDSSNSLELIYESATQVKARFPGSQINVWGNVIKNDHNIHTWDMTLDLDTGVTEAASTYYYFYITEDGDKVISNLKPYDRREDLGGRYHPHNSWRCVGYAFNNASSNLEQVESYYRSKETNVIRSVAATDIILPRDRVILLSGASFTQYLPPAASCKGSILEFVHNDTSLTKVYTLDGFSSETIGGSTTYALYTNGETLKIISDGTNWIVLGHRTNTAISASAVITIGATSVAPTKATTVVIDRAYWSREGKYAYIQYEYEQTGAGGANGTGDYLYTLPTGLTIDTTYVTAETGAGVAAYSSAYGALQGQVNGTTVYNGIAVPYSTTQFRVIDTSGSAVVWGAAVVNLGAGTSVNFGGWIKVPITGWNP